LKRARESGYSGTLHDDRFEPSALNVDTAVKLLAVRYTRKAAVAILSENGLIGKVLLTVFGYEAGPTGMHVVC